MIRTGSGGQGIPDGCTAQAKGRCVQGVKTTAGRLKFGQEEKESEGG